MFITWKYLITELTYAYNNYKKHNQNCHSSSRWNNSDYFSEIQKKNNNLIYYPKSSLTIVMIHNYVVRVILSWFEKKKRYLYASNSKQNPYINVNICDCINLDLSVVGVVVRTFLSIVSTVVEHFATRSKQSGSVNCNCFSQI